MKQILLAAVLLAAACDAGLVTGSDAPQAAAIPEQAFPGEIGEWRTGVVRTEAGEFEVTYQAIHGKAVLDGDVILPIPVEPDGADPDDGIGSSTHEVAAIIPAMRWPGGVIYFNIAPDFADPSRVWNAINHWQANTPIRFVQHTTQPNWVEFVNGPGCSSNLGMIGGRQPITLGDGCLTGQAIHEIGHAVGLFHEQSRLDRDSYVNIYWNNIDPEMQNQFQNYIQLWSGFDIADDLAGYDYGSIMHYGSCDFSIYPQCTPLVPSGRVMLKKDGTGIVANRTALSSGDIMGVRAMYPSPGFTYYGHWRWGHGIGSNRQFLADVTGDGKEDAVVYFGNTGSWYVAPSYGSGFANYGLWISGHGIGSWNQFLADVNGDHRADAIVYFGGGGDWYVSLSTGGGFTNYSHWRWGHGIGSSSQMVADVTGDGMADAVVYFGSNGYWYVAPSYGSGFANYGLWRWGHGIGSNRQFLADVTGDGRADAIVYFGNTGSWYVAPSWGGGFADYSLWISGHGVGSWNQLLGDVNGDRRADAVVYFGGDGSWYGALSNGGQFMGWTKWASGHGIGSWNQLLGDGTGDGRADATVYFGGGGDWYVAPAVH
jgi:hypothetical protein